MSAALLKKSLEIVEAGTVQQRNIKSSKRKSQNPFAPPSSLGQLPEYRVSKKSKLAAPKNQVQKKRQEKSAIQQAHDRIRNSQTQAEENLQKLLMFSSVKLDEDTTKKLLRRAQNKKYIIDEPKPVEESSTVFTDEDFAKFEREYFVG